MNITGQGLNVISKDLLCDPMPETKRIQLPSGLWSSISVPLPWKMSGVMGVKMVRLCIWRQQHYMTESGLCPKGLYPLLTISHEGLMKSLSERPEEKELIKRMQFVGNLSTGNLTFLLLDVNKEDNGSIFQLMAKLNIDGEISLCHDLTRYYLVKESKMNDTTPSQPTHPVSTPKIPKNESKMNDTSPSLPTHPVPTSKKPKNDELSGGRIAGIVIGCIIGLVVLIVIFLYKKGKCAKKVPNNGVV